MDDAMAARRPTHPQRERGTGCSVTGAGILGRNSCLAQIRQGGVNLWYGKASCQDFVQLVVCAMD